MIKSSAPSYASPLSHQHLIEIADLQRQRVKMTQDAALSIETKIQKNLDPELTRVFNIRAKTLIDLFA